MIFRYYKHVLTLIILIQSFPVYADICKYYDKRGRVILTEDLNHPGCINISLGITEKEKKRDISRKQKELSSIEKK